jgi:hypothetical protein
VVWVVRDNGMNLMMVHCCNNVILVDWWWMMRGGSGGGGLDREMLLVSLIDTQQL